MKIKDKVIIVTGASAGIGEATARELAKRGAKVVLAARTVEKINKLEQELPGSFAVATDMADKLSIRNMVEAVVEKYGRIDVLVNNAGQGMYGSVEDIDIDDYRYIFELNVVGVILAMQNVIPIMRKQGGGMIVNISSGLSKMYLPSVAAYASTKYALNALSLTARKELEKDNIIVSVMLPTLTSTDFGKNARQNKRPAEYRPGARPNMPTADTVEYVAEKIAETIETGEAEVYAHDSMKANTENP
ncbi:SDR family NAD(P)-dependent oxidoreductase [Candidatus Parcubacteria bacterium]|nr:SDR family NAD(P)-dependent oxidoreductase [Candidatus Parcubacteria bacterium]